MSQAPSNRRATETDHQMGETEGSGAWEGASISTVLKTKASRKREAKGVTHLLQKECLVSSNPERRVEVPWLENTLQMQDKSCSLQEPNGKKTRGR